MTDDYKVTKYRSVYHVHVPRKRLAGFVRRDEEPWRGFEAKIYKAAELRRDPISPYAQWSLGIYRTKRDAVKACVRCINGE